MLKNFTILLVLTMAFNVGLAQKKQEKRVRKSFESYKDAILNDKGAKAVACVDSRTIKYYSEILETSKSADSASVNALGLLDKLMVLTIRHRATKEQILGFDGSGLFVFAVESGMVGKNSVAHNSVGDVEISGTFAKGRLLSYGDESPFYFHFYLEEEVWKLDLTSAFQLAAPGFRKMQEQSGKEENEYVLYLLELVSDRKPASAVWHPVE